MRIGLLTDVYRPGFSGVANHVILLKQSFQNMGLDARIFAFENPGKIHPIDDVYFSPGITLAANYPFGFRLSRQAAMAIQEMDILHVHQPFASGYVALKQFHERRVPLVFTSHTRYDLFSKAYLPWLPTSLSLFAVRRYMRYFSNHLRWIISPGPEMADMLRSWQVQTPIQVIPNGIDIGAFRRTASRPASLRSQLGISEDSFLFLYAGRIATEKNLLYLIQCFSKVARLEDRSYLVLAGGGPRLQETRDYARSIGLEQRVRFTGPINYSEMPGMMHAADAFVTASKSEVHPLTVIEAAAAGLPVVALDAPGIRGIVQDRVTGFLCEESQEQLVEKMVYLVRNPAETARMADNAARGAERYSYEATARCVLDLYQTVLEAK